MSQGIGLEEVDGFVVVVGEIGEDLTGGHDGPHGSGHGKQRHHDCRVAADAADDGAEALGVLPRHR